MFSLIVGVISGVILYFFGTKVYARYQLASMKDEALFESEKARTESEVLDIQREAVDVQIGNKAKTTKLQKRKERL